MQITRRFLCSIFLSATLCGSVTTFAREENVAQGQLLRLDSSAHKMVIRTAQGSQIQCTYNGQTRVVGAGANVADLPTMSRVTVHYAKVDMAYVATTIEVQE